MGAPLSGTERPFAKPDKTQKGNGSTAAQIAFWRYALKAGRAIPRVAEQLLDLPQISTRTEVLDGVF
jgi:hypothetical protein